jgi:hypothetical protein
MVAPYLPQRSMSLPPFENHQTNEFLLMQSNLHIFSRLNLGGISVELIRRNLRSTLQISLI